MTMVEETKRVKFKIPLSCPICGNQMYAIGSLVGMLLPKGASWQICKKCGFRQSSEDFKSRLLTV